jgi:hypothetical protein
MKGRLRNVLKVERYGIKIILIVEQRYVKIIVKLAFICDFVVVVSTSDYL